MTVPQKKHRIYRELAVYGTLLAMMVLGYLYTNHVARQICGIIVLMDDRNQRTPLALPPDATAQQRQQYEDAKQFVAAIHDYRNKIGC